MRRPPRLTLIENMNPTPNREGRYGFWLYIVDRPHDDNYYANKTPDGSWDITHWFHYIDNLTGKKKKKICSRTIPPKG